MVTRRYTGSPCDGSAFALACQALAAESRLARRAGRLLGAPGEVLAEVDDPQDGCEGLADECSVDAYTKRRRSPWGRRLLTALLVAPAVWLAGALVAVVGGSLGVRWFAAALVWPRLRRA